MDLAKKDGVETELVSGVTSYDAAAARLGIALCEGGEELHIGTAWSSRQMYMQYLTAECRMKSCFTVQMRSLKTGST